jgi:hypothetical protein
VAIGLGVGQRRLKNFIRDWEHQNQLRRVKVDGEKYPVLLPPAASDGVDATK